MDQLTKIFLGAVAGAIAGCLVWSWFWIPPEEQTEAEKLFEAHREAQKRMKRYE